MASTVLSGTGNFSYTNSTGQNVRLVINYMQGSSLALNTNTPYSTWTMSWAGVNLSINLAAIGRNLAAVGTYGSQNAYPITYSSGFVAVGAAPTEIMLAVGQTFSTSISASASAGGAVLGVYNIVIIPEAG